MPIFLVCVNWVQDIDGAFFSLEASYESKLYMIKIPNNNVVDAQACSAELTELESMTEDQEEEFNQLLPPQDLSLRPSSSINTGRVHGRLVACFN